jgi:cortactin
MCILIYRLDQLRQNVQQDYQKVKTEELESGPKASYGYGGKFGVQQDRMDKVCKC